jgi:hypothetical protein
MIGSIMPSKPLLIFAFVAVVTFPRLIIFPSSMRNDKRHTVYGLHSLSATAKKKVPVLRLIVKYPEVEKCDAR